MLNDTELRKEIREVLTNRPEVREDDLRLISNLWWRQLKRAGKQDISSKDFLALVASGDLYHFESVRRERQKLQEHHPELRGPKYGKRKDKSDKMKHSLNHYNPDQPTSAA